MKEKKDTDKQVLFEPVMRVPKTCTEPLMQKFQELSEKLTIIGEEDVQEIRDRLREKPDDRIICVQKGGQTDMNMSTADISIVGGSRGGGKGQPYDSPVVTPFGMRRMGDLEVGSIVTDIHGGMQKVICITELGHKKVFRLHFSDGTHVDCTDDHLWKIKQTNVIHKTRKLNGTGQEADWRLWTMQMIAEHIDANGSNLLVPLCEPVKFTKNDPHGYKPKSDPYVIGAILGDGCITESVMNGGYDALLSCADKEIADCFEDAGIDMSNFGQKSKARDYRIKDERLKEDLTELKLYGHYSYDKFIPEYYKYAPLNERWALVQGLMDTDGTADTRGHCLFATASKEMAETFAFILRSLGAYVTVSVKPRHYTKDGERVKCADCYELYIKMKETQRLFRLSRKKARCKPYNGGVSEPTKRITGYEIVGYDKCRCIAVSDPSALYLTEDFTVTHNSYVLLLETLYDILNKNFRGIIFRKDLDDLSDIIDTSQELYSEFGTYNRAKNDMTWNFDAGGWLTFSFFNMDDRGFTDRYQGKQYAYIGIDEITQMPFKYFKVLTMSNRNAYNMRSRIIGSCNPDPDSWVAKFVEQWIDQETGLAREDMAGATKYCFMDGDDVTQVIWGDTKEEVFEKCKGTIMTYWKKEYEQYGSPVDTMIKSVRFIPAKLSENIALMSSDPAYLANLIGQDDETRARFLDGNWKYKAAGHDLVKLEHMDMFYNNSEQIGDGIRRVTCDAAFDGGDQCVFYLWVGNHISDIATCKKDSKSTVEYARALLERWRVREDNFAYDLIGTGQVFKGFFPKAIPFNAKEAVDEKFRGMFYNLKAQSFQYFADHLKDGTYSIAPELLTRRFSGRGYKNKTLKEILNEERRCIRFREDDPTRVIDKAKQMKRLIHRSPDFVEGAAIREIFNIKMARHKPHNMGLLGGMPDNVRKQRRNNPFNNYYGNSNNGRRW